MMELLPTKEWILFALVFVVSLAATEIVRVLAHRFQFVSKPAAGRWNQRVVALGGGVAINVALIVGILNLDSSIFLGVLLPLVLLFALGLFDDLWGSPPSAKLIMQAAAAAIAISQGYVFPFPWPVLGIAVTVLWFVGLSNAVNLIDNMDGLSAGATLVAALGFVALLGGDPTHLSLALVLAGATAGFLVHNFYPARIFMGDAGSLSLGFLVALLCTRIRVNSASLDAYWSLVPAVFVLIVPIFDTILVTISRRNAGRPISTGGRDHTSHRLVSLGLSERRAVLLLYFVGFLGAAGARLLVEAEPFLFISVAVGFAAIVCLYGLFMMEVVVYKEPHSLPISALGKHPLPQPVLHFVEVAVDVCVICVAWTVAHQIRFFDTGLFGYETSVIIPAIPYIIVGKLAAFSVFKLYRGVWRSVPHSDVYRIFKAVSLGTLLVIAGAALSTRLEDLSRMVIVLDWLLTFVGILGARAALSGFRRWSRKLSTVPLKAALYGSQTLLDTVREAVQREAGVQFMGIIVPDYEPISSDSMVLGRYQDLEKVLHANGIELLIIADASHDSKVGDFSDRGIFVRRISIQLT